MEQGQGGLPILAFPSQQALEAWLADPPPAAAQGIWLKLAKQGSGLATVSQREAVESALCYGWIDGQLAKYDEQHWLIRYTPRRPRSKWSERNREAALALIAAGRMQPGGLAEVARAQADGRWEAAYAPQSTATVPDDLQAALTETPAAQAAFDRLNKAERYAILYRIGEAKRPETRARRITQFVAQLAQDAE